MAPTSTCTFVTTRYIIEEVFFSTTSVSTETGAELSRAEQKLVIRWETKRRKRARRILMRLAYATVGFASPTPVAF